MRGTRADCDSRTGLQSPFDCASCLVMRPRPQWPAVIGRRSPVADEEIDRSTAIANTAGRRTRRQQSRQGTRFALTVVVAPSNASTDLKRRHLQKISVSVLLMGHNGLFEYVQRDALRASLTFVAHRDEPRQKPWSKRTKRYYTCHRCLSAIALTSHQFVVITLVLL